MNSFTHRYNTVLTWLSKISRTDMHYLAKEGSWLLTGQLVSSLLTLLLAVAFANWVSVTIYGTYKYILALAGIFAIFTMPGLDQAVSRAAAQGNTATLRAATLSRVRYSLIGSAVAILGSLYYYTQGNDTLGISLLVVAVTIPVFETFTLYLAHLIGIKDFYRHAQYTIFVRVVSFLLIVLAIAVSGNIFWILVAYYAPSALLHFILYTKTAQSLTQDTHHSTTAEVLHFGKHLTAMKVLGVVSSNLDKILLWHFLGPIEVAVYAFALALPQAVKGIFKNIGTLAFPKFAQKQMVDIKRDFTRKMLIFLAGLSVVTAAYALAAPFIFDIFFSNYTNAIPYSQLYAVTILFLPAVLFTNLFTAHKKINELYIMKILNPVLLIVFYILCIPWFGILGAIMSVLATNVISLLLWIVLLKKAT